MTVQDQAEIGNGLIKGGKFFAIREISMQKKRSDDAGVIMYFFCIIAV